MYELRPRTSRSARSRRARSACIVTKSCTPQRNHTTCAAHNECKEDARTMHFVPSTEWASAVGIEKSGAGLIDAPRLLCSCNYSRTDACAKEVMCTGLTQWGWTGVYQLITRFRVNCRNDRYILQRASRASAPYQIPDRYTHTCAVPSHRRT